MCKCLCLSCSTPGPPRSGGWRSGAYSILFGSQILTKASIGINVTFILLILASIVVVLVDSLQSVKETLGSTMNYVELCFSVLFTLEYIIRLMCVRRCWVYMISFMGVIDFLSAVPALFALLYSPLATLVLLRILKVSRIFRLFKLIGIFKAYSELLFNVERNLLKMVVFVIGFWSICVVLGGFMHLLELENPAFDNMFKAVYWAVVTLTTVGYGDAVPVSSAGQVLAAVTMTLGYTFVVLGLRHQIPLPGASGQTGDNSAPETSHHSAASYVTMGDEIHLDEEGGVEMQAQSPRIAHVDQEHEDSDGDVEASEHGSLHVSGSMRKMISFPANDESSLSLSQQILPPAQGVYHHQDDDEALPTGDSDGLDETKDSFDEGDEGYRRTYDHSL